MNIKLRCFERRISQWKALVVWMFPQTRWFSGGKWGLPPMKRDVSSRLAITPRVGVRIETGTIDADRPRLVSHPAWVCGLKLRLPNKNAFRIKSHPAWVCGLNKPPTNLPNHTQTPLPPSLHTTTKTAHIVETKTREQCCFSFPKKYTKIFSPFSLFLLTSPPLTL